MHGQTNIDKAILLLEKELMNLTLENWMNEVVFAWQWWLLIAVLIIPWLIWWKYVDRTRLLEISIVGLVIAIFASYLDSVLTRLGLWYYNYTTVPFWACCIPADITVLPIVYMFVYQFFRSAKGFLIAMIILSGFLSFAGEHFLELVHIYKTYGWEHHYSFPIYIAIGFMARWVARTLKTKQSAETAKKG